MSLFGDTDINDDFDDDGNSSFAPPIAETLQPPQQSSYFIGHDKIEQDILSLWNANRMPHALVLNGLKGIGKATFAYRLARFILKETSQNTGGLLGDDSTPENLSIADFDPVFAKVASGGHPDILTISRPFDEKKGQQKDDIPVSDIRKVAPFLRKTSSDGGWRIVIIDDANTMNCNGQNALLKILEEPPKNVLILLITHGAGGLLPTIRSRCRFISFDKLNDEAVIKILNKSSDVPVLSSDADIITALSEGSAGKAVDLNLDGGIEAVNIVLNALLNIHEMSESQIDALALSYGKSGDSNIIKKFTFIINWWFETLILLSASGLKTTHIGGIDIVVPAGHGLKSLLQLHEDVEVHIQSCLNGNLDKRYMIYKTLRMIQDAHG